MHGAFLRAPTELVCSRRPGSSVVVTAVTGAAVLFCAEALRRASAPSQRTKN